MPSTTQALSKSAAAVLPRILVVDDEPELVELIADAVGRSMGCRLLRARSVGEAQAILEQGAVDLLVTDVYLADGDGTSLLPVLRKHNPGAGAIVVSGTPSVEGAITALRNGAVDFVCKPFTGADLAQRVRNALARQGVAAKTERRLTKLREAVRRLNDARKVVTKKVDLLCNDLVSAYGELSRQLDLVRTQEGFKNCLAGVKDLEQLLCHTMDYLMRQMGYCNIAIWLAGDAPAEGAAKEGDETGGPPSFQLGAYMKYTLAGDQDLTEALRLGLVPVAAKQGFLHLSGDEAQERLTAAELDYLADQDVMTVNCTYLGETLAVVVLFRDAKAGFIDADAECFQAVGPMFAVALANAVRPPEGEAADESDEGEEEGGGGLLDEPSADERKSGGKKKKPKGKQGDKPSKNNDDWWKNGDPPPF